MLLQLGRNRDAIRKKYRIRSLASGYLVLGRILIWATRLIAMRFVEYVYLHFDYAPVLPCHWHAGCGREVAAHIGLAASWSNLKLIENCLTVREERSKQDSAGGCGAERVGVLEFRVLEEVQMNQVRIMLKFTRAGLCAVLLIASFTQVGADELSQRQMRSLDEQVQEVKTDVLSIATDLGRLEERLLYPSNTQVAVFVSVPDDAYRLDSVKLEVDGELVAHYIYSFKELEALQSGGVQRLYTGNVPTGEHSLNVTYAGQLENGKEFSKTGQFVFAKAIEPKMLGLTLAAASGGSGIELQDW